METQTASTVDVTRIMEDIRTEIKEKGYQSEILSFADVPLESASEYRNEHFDTDILHNNVQYLTANHTIELERNLSGNPIGMIWHKLMRRIMRFYIAPYAEAQNGINANLTQAQQQIELYIRESRMYSTKALLERIEMLELQQKNAKLQIEQQQAQITRLQEKLAEEAQP